MIVLIACEFSATVRDAFRRQGHNAWSCDLLPTEGDPKFHFQEDCLAVAHRGLKIGRRYQPWDLMVAHPPCTHLAISGARWFPSKRQEQEDALDFVVDLLNAPVFSIALENPVGVISSRVRKPDQIVEPWQFGDYENKRTCFWLRNLPKLTPKRVVKTGLEGDRVHWAAPGPDRWKERSRTPPKMAEAMAEQWGRYNWREELDRHS